MKAIFYLLLRDLNTLVSCLYDIERFFHIYTLCGEFKNTTMIASENLTKLGQKFGHFGSAQTM